MPGPRTRPQDVGSPIPGDAIPQAMAPEIPQAQAPAESGMTAEAFLQEFGGEEGIPDAPSQAAPSSTPDSAEAFLRDFGDFESSASAPVEAPAEESFADTLKDGVVTAAKAMAPGPLRAIFDIADTVKNARSGTEIKGRAAAKLGKSPDEERRILEKILGPEYATRVTNGVVEFRRPGETAFRPMDPKGFKTLTEAFNDIADVIPDFAQGAVESAAATGGAALGSLAGPVGAVAGGAAAGGAAAMAGMKARDAFIQRVIGVEPEETDATTTALGVGLGMFGGGIAARTALKVIPQKLAVLARSMDETGVAGTARSAGKVMGETVETLRDVIAPVPISRRMAGEGAQNVVERLDNDLGERVAFAWDALKDKVGDGRIVPQEFRNTVEDLLTSPTSAVRGDRQARRQLEAYWQQMENGGFTVPEFERILKDLKSASGFGSGKEKSFAEIAYSRVRLAGARDRDGFLKAAVKGTDAEDYVNQAFSSFSQKIDSIRDIERLADKAPEKFAQTLFNDTKNVRLAKDVFAENPETWASLQSSWLQSHIDASMVDKVGMMDIRRLYDSINKNPDVALEVLGRERLSALKNLAISWDKLNIEDLLQNPNSSKARAFFNGVTKTVAMRSPAQAALTINTLFGGNDEVLRAIQRDGIEAFAKNAANGAERSFWLKTAEGLERIRDASTIKGKPGNVQYEIPVETPLLAPIMTELFSDRGDGGAGRSSRVMSAYDDFTEKERLREIREAPSIPAAPAGKPGMKASVRMSKRGGGPAPKIKSTLPKFNAGSKRR